MRIYIAIRAGTTAAAGTRLNLKWFLVRQLPNVMLNPKSANLNSYHSMI